ncbi:uncharacterized protein LOC121384962 [Gigantopelta aegis]|uniref:uncharacterized protein LOC121384962 n=1 Tax=Gigantopelta aegis TaxID=1735272 RepID=UPI001B88B055|nr:uncharacterized protein LOC121384962 [Gigantopelta aegis]
MQRDRKYGLCQCKAGFVLTSDQLECQECQSYVVIMNVTLRAGRYEYLPLLFRRHFTQNTSSLYLKMVKRLTLLGLDKALGPTSLGGKYLTSEILHFSNNNPGLRVTALVHVASERYNPMPPDLIWNHLNETFYRSNGEIGESRLKLEKPFDEKLFVDDFDECAYDAYNDCSDRAYCINTMASFMCICRPVFDDVSKQRPRRLGRTCVESTTAAAYSEGCGDGDCRTNWEFVGLTLAVLFLVLFALITYEIIHRKRQLSARDAYRRFGRATRQRIQKLRRKSFARTSKMKGGKHIEEDKAEDDSD